MHIEQSIANITTLYPLPGPVKPIQLPEFIANLKSYLNNNEIEAVQAAYEYAKDAHKNQLRETGDEYITHPLYVANILASWRLDHQTLMAGLLHDVIEDTEHSKHTLRDTFSDEAVKLVDGVSKLNTIFNTKVEAQAHNFQKMFLAMAEDVRVILIKLADRLHNMLTLQVMPKEKRLRIARETLDFYAPIAGQLGMDDVRIQLEELGFQFVDTAQYVLIQTAVDEAQGKHSETLELVCSTLRNALQADNIEAKVVSRTKHPYSIYCKTQRTQKPFEDLTDVLAARIIVNNIDACYRALGTVHNTYKPVAGRFKDYIAIPKSNGYQSLHTCLLGASSSDQSSLHIEIQIRTHPMEGVARDGIAGHWLYKSKDNTALANQPKIRQLARSILDFKRHAKDADEFINHLKTELSSGEVYVFSQEGKIIALPPGASPVDFAYALDAKIGNTCAGCRVNRQVAPLSTPLSSGQTVEIITSLSAIPKTEWLSFVVTANARLQIRSGLKRLNRENSIAFGKTLLQRSLGYFDLQMSKLPDEAVIKTLEKLGIEGGIEDTDTLNYQIGIGDRLAYLTARELALQTGVINADADDVLSLKHPGPLIIRGTEGVVVTCATCCHPIPGDAIIGHISRGKGLIIHIETCHVVSRLRRKIADRIYPVQWADDTDADFRAILEVDTKHQKSAIAEIAAAITLADAAIIRMEHERNIGLPRVKITMNVRNRDHLAIVMRNLRHIKDTTHIHRPLRITTVTNASATDATDLAVSTISGG